MELEQRNYRVKEVAQRWQVDETLVYRMVREGKLGSLKIGKAVRIPHYAITAFEAQNETCTNIALEKPKTAITGTSAGQKAESHNVFRLGLATGNPQGAF